MISDLAHPAQLEPRGDVAVLPASGCVSIAVDGARPVVTVDRIIEYFYPTHDGCTIWIDVFFTNHSDSVGDMLVMHRGGFEATDVSRASWSLTSETDDFVFERSLTRRIVSLHRRYCPVTVRSLDSVGLDGAEYTIWNSATKDGLVRLVDNDSTVDAPFSLWRIGPVSGRDRCVFRLRLDMSAATFSAGIGQSRSFVAFGESILLAKIQGEDLPNYTYPDKCRYQRALENFLEAERVIPGTFEYLVIAKEGSVLPWETTPLSPGLVQRSIDDPRLDECTRWFVPDDSANWHLAGNAYKAFALKVTDPPAVVTSTELVAL